MPIAYQVRIATSPAPDAGDGDGQRDASRADTSSPHAGSACLPPPGHAGGDIVFDAPAHRAVLLSAEAAGVTMPSSCRNGTCRACMQLLVSGRVSYRIEWPGLLAEEKAAGWILPCVACPETDLVLQGPPAP